MLQTLTEGLEVLEGRWLLVGAVAAVGLVKAGRPLAKGAIKCFLGTRDGLQRLSSGAREGLRELYDEAATEYQSQARAGVTT